MLKKIKEIWNSLCQNGIKFPYAHDTSTGKPSITLLFPTISGMLLILSVIYLHAKPSAVVGTAATFMFWISSMILYMMRRIHKADIDFDDNSISLESGDKKQSKKKDSGKTEAVEYYYEDEDK